MVLLVNQLLYELPEDREAVAEIVRAIPSGWRWVDGYLSAPRELYRSGKVAGNTRLVISRFYLIKPTIIGADDVPYEDEKSLRKTEQGLLIPRIADVILRGKLCSSVSFDEAGFKPGEISIDAVKELAGEFIRRGYKGRLHTYSGYQNNNKYDNPETFSFTHARTGGGTIVHPRPLPPHISLEWDPRHGGKREHLESIIAELERIRVRQLWVQ